MGVSDVNSYDANYRIFMILKIETTNKLLKSIEMLINITPRKSLDMKSSYIYTNKIKIKDRGSKTFQILDEIKEVFKKNNFKTSIGWV